MPDLDQIKQGEQGVRDRRGRFAARLLLAGEGTLGRDLAADPLQVQRSMIGVRNL
jgi:hypothetical protein